MIMRFWHWLTKSRLHDEIERLQDDQGPELVQEARELLARPVSVRRERNSEDEHYYKQLCDHLEGGYVTLMRLRAQSELRRRKV